MKIRTLLLTLAAAVAFASCSKEPIEDNIPDKPVPKIQLRLQADTTPEAPAPTANTRTEFGENYLIKWLDTDQIGLHINSATPTVNAEGTVDRDKTSGVVTFMALVNVYAANDMLYGYYPLAATNPDPQATLLTIPAAQAQSAVGVFNGSTHPLVAVPIKFTSDNPDEIISERLKFRQTGAMAEYAVSTSNPAYEGEVIRSVRFTNTTAEFVAGTFTYDLTSVSETGSPAPIDKATVKDGSNSIIVSLPANSTAALTATPKDNLLYMTVMPGAYTGDFVVTTDKATYTFAGKSVDFPRAFVRRFALNLNNAVRSERISGLYTWTAVAGDLSTSSSAPKPVVSLGTPALSWDQTTSDPYFGWDAGRGIQIGASSTTKTVETLSTDGYGDEIKAIAISGAVASSSTGQLSVYLDNALLGTQEVAGSASSATVYTFAPATPVKAGNIRIVLTPQTKKAAYLMSIVIYPNAEITKLPAPAPSVSEKTISWAAVANATGYVYSTNNGTTELPVTGTSIDCSVWSPGAYSVTVRALGDDILYSHSDWSAPANITIEAPVVNGRYIRMTSEPTDWSGTYLIANVEGNVVYALNGQDGTSTWGRAEDISSRLQDDGSITSDDISDACACTIEKSANGYTIKHNDVFLGFTGSSNSLYFNPTAAAKTYEWTIAYNSPNVKIANVNTTSRVIWYNYNSGNNPRFACYTTTTMKPVALYQLEDKTPRIVVDKAYNPLSFKAEVVSGAIPFTVKNLSDGVTATVTEAIDNWFSATVDNAAGTINWTTTAHIGTTARTATLTLSAAGAENVVIAVTQAAPPQKLATPQNLHASATGALVSATWDAVANAPGYAWRIATGGADAASGTTASTSAEITGLNPATAYTLYVKATGNGDTLLDSEEAEVGVTTASIPQLTMTSVSIDNAKTTGASLTAIWTTVANASGYVYKVTAAGGTEIEGETPLEASATSATVTGLSAQTTYTIWVKATGNGVSYADSEYASADGTTTGVQAGPAWSSYSFTTSTIFTTAGTNQNLSSSGAALSWLCKKTGTGTLGAETSGSARGLQLQKNAEVTLTTSGYSGGVQQITLNLSRSGGGMTAPNVTITVDGKVFTPVTPITCGTTAQDFTFQYNGGEIVDATGKEISIQAGTTTSSNYMKYIKIN